MSKTTCFNCGELLVHANIGDGIIDIYCEDCYWSDDCLSVSLNCVVCGLPSVGECGDQMRCEEHWRDS